MTAAISVENMLYCTLYCTVTVTVQLSVRSGTPGSPGVRAPAAASSGHHRVNRSSEATEGSTAMRRYAWAKEFFSQGLIYLLLKCIDLLYDVVMSYSI